MALKAEAHRLQPQLQKGAWQVEGASHLVRKALGLPPPGLRLEAPVHFLDFPGLLDPVFLLFPNSPPRCPSQCCLPTLGGPPAPSSGLAVDSRRLTATNSLLDKCGRAPSSSVHSHPAPLPGGHGLKGLFFSTFKAWAPFFCCPGRQMETRWGFQSGSNLNCPVGFRAASVADASCIAATCRRLPADPAFTQAPPPIRLKSHAPMPSYLPSFSSVHLSLPDVIQFMFVYLFIARIQLESKAMTAELFHILFHPSHFFMDSLKPRAQHELGRGMCGA